MRSFGARVVGACCLRADVFEDVERDESSAGQACLVVVLVGLAAGVGSIGNIGAGASGVILGTLAGLAAWGAWAVLILLIGTRLLPGPRTQVDVGQLLRTLAFAASPGLLQALAAVSLLRTTVIAVSILWMLAAMVVAVRQALDYERTGRAVTVCVLAAGLVVAVATVVGVLFPKSVS